MADLLYQVPCTLHFKVKGDNEALATLQAQMMTTRFSELFIKFNDPRINEADAILSFDNSDIPERTK